MSESAAHSSHKLMIASFDHAAATQERVCTHACVSVSTDGQYIIPAAACVCMLMPEASHYSMSVKVVEVGTCTEDECN